MKVSFDILIVRAVFVKIQELKRFIKSRYHYRQRLRVKMFEFRKMYVVNIKKFPVGQRVIKVGLISQCNRMIKTCGNLMVR